MLVLFSREHTHTHDLFTRIDSASLLIIESNACLPTQAEKLTDFIWILKTRFLFCRVFDADGCRLFRLFDVSWQAL